MNPTSPPFGFGRPTGAPVEPAPAPPAEPYGLLDLEEPPVAYDLDEAGVVPRDPRHLLLYWEARGGGELVFRLHPSRDGETLPHLDIPLPRALGRVYVGTPHAGRATHVAGALGRVIERAFHPIAHAPRVRLPSDVPGADAPVEWMEVAPGATRGIVRERPAVVRRGASHPPGERGLPHWDERFPPETPGSRVPRQDAESDASSPHRWGK
jgi:hypothetical protein